MPFITTALKDAGEKPQVNARKRGVGCATLPTAIQIAPVVLEALLRLPTIDATCQPWIERRG